MDGNGAALERRTTGKSLIKPNQDLDPGLGNRQYRFGRHLLGVANQKRANLFSKSWQ